MRNAGKRSREANQANYSPYPARVFLSPRMPLGCVVAVLRDREVRRSRTKLGSNERVYER